MGFNAGGTYIGSSVQVASAQITNAKLGTDIAIGSTTTILPIAVTVVQGDWVVGANSNVYVCGYRQNSVTPLQNDEYTVPCYLSAGTYTISFWGVSSPAQGIITLSIDGTSAGTADYYSAGTVNNVLKQITGVAVATNGLKTISFKIATKHASSSGYESLVGIIQFTRTS